MDQLDLYFEEYLMSINCKLRFLLSQYSIAQIIDRIMSVLNSDKTKFIEITTIARDLYIGSDLTLGEKEQYYSELKQRRFFEHLEPFLYVGRFHVCSWTIYTIGKFSDQENVAILEKAYETKYKFVHPLLSYRCLSELDWLGSGKVQAYLEELEDQNSLWSKLVLAYYWEPHSYSSSFNMMIRDKELRELIAPGLISVNDDAIERRLLNFNIFISQLYGNDNTTEEYLIDFVEEARKYFAAYIDTSTEKRTP